MEGLTRRQRIAQRAERRAARAKARAERRGHTATSSADVPPQSPPCTPLGPWPFGTPDGRYLPLEGVWRDAAIFLLLSGPSLRTLPLDRLGQRGICTMGVNQTPALWRPNFWIGVDNVRKFHDGLWRDPGVVKFVPVRPRTHMDRPLQSKRPDGTFETLLRPDGQPVKVGEMPGVVGYWRNPIFRPETWLSEPTVNWGNNKKGAKANGHPHVLNVMFAALKTCYLLGFRTVFLLGCDFYMAPGHVYAFEQAKHIGGCESNNRCYGHLNQMFGLLAPYFDAAGFRVYNTNPQSGLTVFPHISFHEAVALARREMPAEPWDVRGWYETVEGPQEEN